MSTALKIVLVIAASLVAIFVALIVVAALVLPGKLRESSQSAAHNIADFTVPPGFAMTFGLALGPMSEVTLTSNDRHNPMIIFLVGLNAPRGAGSADLSFRTSFVKSEEQHCAHIERLSDETIRVNGEVDVFQRVVCTGANQKEQMIEFGNFAGKSPTSMLTASGPAQTWNAKPIHELLNSIH